MPASDNFSFRDFFAWLALCWIVTVVVVSGRLVGKLSRDPVPPLTPEALAIWRRKRWWMVAAEIAATPALALAAVLLAYMSGWNIIVSMIAAYAAALGGIPFLAHVMLQLVGQKLGVEVRAADINQVAEDQRDE